MINGSAAGSGHTRAGFWRRLSAVWIDTVIIYSIVTFAVPVAEMLGIRLSLEPVVMVLAAVYGVTLLTMNGQTVGKRLAGIAVRMKDGSIPGAKSIILREVIGKWTISVIAPMAIGRFLVGAAWVPTAMDLIVLLPVPLILAVYYMITKSTWYDKLADTTVVYIKPQERGSTKPARVILTCAVLLALCTHTAVYTINGYLPSNLALYHSMHPIGPYVSFLQKQHTSPVDYVMNLFEYNDVVILCERAHPEVTQWDFIFDLVSDTRFTERVGRVFTEYVQRDEQPYLDTLMATPGLSDEEVHSKALHFLRNMLWPVWTNTNFHTYLKRLYGLNRSLPGNRRVHHYFSEVELHWEQMNDKEDYRAWGRRNLRGRDSLMAELIIEKMTQIQASPKEDRKKCLVIMNYRHAWPIKLGRDPQGPKGNTADFLFEAFPGRTANVLLGSYTLFAPIHGGVWDDAFESIGNPRLGFDLADSPFGKDDFDLFPFPWPKANYRFEDVLTGLVFTHPLSEQYFEKGVTGFLDGYKDEALRRAKLINYDEFEDAVQTIALYNTPDLPVKEQMFSDKVSTWVELAMAGILTAGLLIIGFFSAMNLRRKKEKRVEV